MKSEMPWKELQESLSSPEETSRMRCVGVRMSRPGKRSDQDSLTETWTQKNIPGDNTLHESEPSKVLVDQTNPDHYRSGAVESIDMIDSIVADPESFYLGNALKYLHRCREKGSFRVDIAKAIWYLERILEKRDE